MLFSPELLLAMQAGPPPQAVLDKRPLWYVFIGLLGFTMFLRMIIFDIMGGMLCGLLLLLSVVMIRDGMKELPRLGLIFGLLCAVNVMFYTLPMLTNILGGRSERHVEPVSSLRYSNTHQLTYTLTLRTRPFFDWGAGLLYNTQSVGMLAMPFCMLLGAYLGISTHHEIQRQSPSLLGAAEDGGGLHFDGHGRGEFYGALPGMAAGATLGERAQSPPLPRSFQGVAHKLGR